MTVFLILVTLLMLGIFFFESDISIVNSAVIAWFFIMMLALPYSTPIFVGAESNVTTTTDREELKK